MNSLSNQDITDEPEPLPGGPLAWLQLMRLPTVFTALSNLVDKVIELMVTDHTHDGLALTGFCDTKQLGRSMIVLHNRAVWPQKHHPNVQQVDDGGCGWQYRQR